MDERLRQLERAARDAPADPAPAVALAREWLRAGRPARALTAARGHAGEPAADAVRREAAAALARRLEVSSLGVNAEGFEAFARRDEELVLVPGGAFLEDGPEGVTAARSLLLPGGARAPLRPVALPDLLIGALARPEPRRAVASAAARALGGRLPRPGEWKKAWRGGLHLDGDASATRPNPLPDRTSPWDPDPVEPDGAVRSPYGLEIAARDAEWHEDAEDELLIFSGDAGRYRAPLGRALGARRAAWRLVLELPPDV